MCLFRTSIADIGWLFQLLALCGLIAWTYADTAHAWLSAELTEDAALFLAKAYHPAILAVDTRRVRVSCIRAFLYMCVQSHLLGDC